MSRCEPVCWTLADGGWAARSWELFQTVSTNDGMTGALVVDWNAFRCAVSADVLADDDERMRLMRAMKLCASVLNNPKAALFTSTEASDDED